MHGFLAEWLGECAGVAGAGDASEARILFLLMTSTTLAAAALVYPLTVAISVHQPLVADGIIVLIGQPSLT